MHPPIPIDWTINLGNLVPIIVMFSIVISKMSRMETKVDTMWKYFTDNIVDAGGNRIARRRKEDR